MTEKVLKYILFFCLAGFVLISATSKVNDPDVFQYLAHGKYILEHGFGGECVFNYSSQTCQIAFSEWLFHVLTYFVYLIGQWNALVAFQIIIILAIFIIIFINSRKCKYSLFSTILFVFAAVIIGMERFMLRADLFGLLMAVAFYFVFRSYLNKAFPGNQEKNYTHLIFLLLFIQIVWANTHGSFPLAFGIVGAFLAAELIKPLWGRYILSKKTEIFSKKTVIIGVILILCVLVSLINPFGLKAFFWPFGFFFGSSEFYSQTEFESPFKARDFYNLSIRIYELLSFSALVVLLLSYRKIKLAEIIILAAFFYLSARAVRNIALFAFFSALILPAYLDYIILKSESLFRRKNEKLKKIGFAARQILIVLLVVFMTKIAYGMVTDDFYMQEQRSRRFGFGVSGFYYPGRAFEFIKNNSLQGKIFNDYTTGASINWGLFPRYQSFIDGHSYTSDLLKYYRDIMTGATPYQETVQKFQINLFLLNHAQDAQNLKLISELYRDKNWTLIYFDDTVVIFIANNPENRDVIEKYAIDFQTNKNFDSDNLAGIEKSDYPLVRANRGIFFARLDLLDKAKYEFQKSLEAYPRNYIVYSNLGAIYHRLSEDDSAIEACKKSLKIRSDFAPAHFNIALLYQKKGRWDEAIKEHKKALGINRAYLFAHYNLGVCYEEKKDFSRAKTEYLAELKINPEFQYARDALNRLSQSGQK